MARIAKSRIQPNKVVTKTRSVIRTGTKSAILVALLERKQGGSIAEMILATGWQALSVRGFLAGALEKATRTAADHDGR